MSGFERRVMAGIDPETRVESRQRKGWKPEAKVTSASILWKLKTNG
jgi:hypothetical protein